MPTSIEQGPAIAPVAPQGLTAGSAANAATVAAAVAANQANVADFKAQIQTLSDQLTALASQRSGIAAEILATRGSLRATARGQLRQIDAQIADLSGQLANAGAQLAFQEIPAGLRGQGTLVPPAPPSAYLHRQMDPDLIAGIMFAIVFAVFMPIAIGYSRRLWRRGGPPAPSPQFDTIAPRLDRLEQSVDAIAIEIERIAEGQRFVTKVLVERPKEQASMPAPDMRDASKGAANGGEPRPFLAIGAGAIEPIRGAERQAVRQSVTPH